MQLFYSWPADMDVDVLYAFRRAVMNRYADMMNDARGWAIKRLLVVDGVAWDGYDYSMLSAHNPTFIANEYWVQMINQVRVLDYFYVVVLFDLCFVFNRHGTTMRLGAHVR